MCPAIFNRLESFSNELLLDIFEYLDAYNLYQAFYGLNYRINGVLQSAHLHIFYDSSNENKPGWDTLISSVNPSQIRILSCYKDINIDNHFLSAAKENLRSLCLCKVYRPVINTIFQHFSSGNKIKCLSIREHSRFTKRSDHSLFDLILIDNAHRFTSLVNLSLSCTRYMNVSSAGSVRFLQLRHLSISNCYWSTNFLQLLQSNIPNLKSLKFIGHYHFLNLPSDFVLKRVDELHMNYSGNFVCLHNILSVFPCLRRLYIDQGSSRRYAIINGVQWQKLIENYLPDLRQLTIDFGDGIDDDIVEAFYTGEFWSTKKVNVKMIIDKTYSRYRLVKTIYFGRQWQFRYFDNFDL
ncbi:unnamed protein product [Rotaria sordida]|uniref:F-box domain-containing protein n=1 Tax=Rotaria sordida TaxID=392033 RepID=A0A819F1M1_9BILA|nr:unnamed protein product [Rotaria sordida]